MREIKFRAWDLDKKIMFNACFVGIGKVFSMTKTFKPSKQLENVIVMQDTGLKDKNGKEIYEGDIVKILDYYNNIGIVEYSAPNFHIFDGDDGATDFDHNEWAYFEVIGNIYENPELLDKD